ncbi:hypothetical protein QEH53_06970 [Pelagicoccus sp. SDUM812002]|nr:hypothetical protein [Pelagicoccus sp. SDUM812002]
MFRLTGAAAGFCIFANALFAQEAAPSISLSDALERAIYLHEGEARLPEAEQAFRGILEESSLIDSIAAEASYRLAVVYIEQGKQALAMSLLSDLVKKYPDEELWVTEATALLPQEFVPEITPWEDGERLYYDWVLPTGNVVGHSFATIYSYDWEGRQLWRKETRYLLNGNRATAVEFDKDTFNTAYGWMYFDEMGNCRAWYGEDGLSVKVEYSKSGASREFEFNERAYDNEQAAELMRQMPIELGYRMTKKIFVSFSGMPIDISFEIVKIEEVDTAIGRIECYEVEIDMHVQKQTVVITTDERRIPVLYRAGGVEGRLTKVETVDLDGFSTYENEEHGFEVEYPASWSAIRQENRSDASDQIVWLAEPMVRGKYMAASELNSDWRREDPISLEGLVEEMSKQISRQFKNVESEARLVRALSVDGKQGQSYVFDAKDSSENADDVYVYIFLGEEKHYFFQAVIAKSDKEDMLPIFEKIVMSLNTNA